MTLIYTKHTKSRIHFRYIQFEENPSYCDKENKQKKLDFCFQFQHETYITPCIQCITVIPRLTKIIRSGITFVSRNLR